MSDPSVQKWMDKVKLLERAGEYLEAVDQGEQALKRLQRRIEPADRVRLQYLLVRTLARSGAVSRALDHYKEYGLDQAAIDENPDLTNREKLDIHALWARILKDRALRLSEKERAAGFVAAARAYEEIFDLEQDSFPGVNAAT